MTSKISPALHSVCCEEAASTCSPAESMKALLVIFISLLGGVYL